MEKVLFKDWLCANYLKDSSYIGDLARDVSDDKTFPDEGSVDDFVSYIEKEGAVEEAVSVLMEAYDLYCQAQRQA